MMHLFRGFKRAEQGKEAIVVNGVKIRGEWVYGDLVHGNPLPMIGYWKAGYRQNDVVIPETVSEALRDLKDKNGKQIYECDVVKMWFEEFDEPEYLTVYYDKKVNGFLCHSNQTTMPVDSDTLNEGEVIGTQWENLNYSNG